MFCRLVCGLWRLACKCLTITMTHTHSIKICEKVRWGTIWKGTKSNFWSDILEWEERIGYFTGWGDEDFPCLILPTKNLNVDILYLRWGAANADWHQWWPPPHSLKFKPVQPGNLITQAGFSKSISEIGDGFNTSTCGHNIWENRIKLLSSVWFDKHLNIFLVSFSHVLNA